MNDEIHIVKYKWLDDAPQLVARKSGKMKNIPLLGSEWNITVGKKECIGYFRDGKHMPCKNQREPQESQCNECKIEDDYFYCIQCDGTRCMNTKKRDECKGNYYYVYLAAFDSVIKVGISYERRIQERLIEQGADIGALVARMQDGMAVREIEQRIRRELNITDRMSGEKKAQILFGDPNASVSNIMSAIKKLRGNGFSKHLYGPEIFDLRHKYGLEHVKKQPKLIDIETGTSLIGNAIAAKGGVLIFQHDSEYFCINAHRLIGRHIEMS